MRQHLGAVLACRHMAHRLAVGPDKIAFGAKVAVGVDLHLDAAVAEDPFGHHGDHVGTVDFAGHDDRVPACSPDRWFRHR